MRYVPSGNCRERNVADLVLKTAVLKFSHYSYEEVTLRDIANEAGCDVAYAQRCFGSKEGLFAAALAASFQPERFLQGDGDELRRNLARSVTEPGLREDVDVDPLEIMVRSLNSSQARSIIRRLLVDDFLSPLSAKLEPPADIRAAAAAATLFGVRVFRDVLGFAAAFDERPYAFRSLMEGVVGACLSGRVLEEARS